MPPALRKEARDADVALVQAATAGDTRAFETLYRRHVGRIHGTVLRLLGHNRSWAEDVVQEAFTRAWQKLDGFRGESAFGTWMYRLAVNTALMALRAQASDPVRERAEESLPEATDVPFCPAQREELIAAIARLPARARAVLVLHDIEGWKHAEIGHELGMAVGTSKAQLHRARGLLKKTLGDPS